MYYKAYQLNLGEHLYNDTNDVGSNPAQATWYLKMETFTAALEGSSKMGTDWREGVEKHTVKETETPQVHKLPMPCWATQMIVVKAYDTYLS